MVADTPLATIAWSPAYEVGIASLDSEHQVLVTLYNDLVRAIARGTSLDLRRECLASIQHWAALHFRNEERLIRGAAANEHTETHRGFVADLARLHAQAKDGRSLHDAARVLRQWLLDHFLEDQILFSRLGQQGRAAP